MLYEYRPSIYILNGLLVNLTIDRPLAHIGAAILIIVGVLIFNLRISNRT